MNTDQARTAAIIPFDRPPGLARNDAYLFGEFSLVPALFELRGRSGPVHVAPKAFDLIVYLVENHQRVATHADLRAALWSGVTVSEASLTFAVSEARRALGDAGKTQVYIRSIRGRGYRFVARVDVLLLEGVPSLRGASRRDATGSTSTWP